MSELGERLIAAAAQVLEPLVQRLLATGVPFGQLEARLRELFVAVAEAEFALADRRQTDSRISLLTGINRKDVRRIRSLDTGAAPRIFSRNLVASLISPWVADPRTSDASSGITSINVRKPSAFFMSFHAIFTAGALIAGSRKSSTGS